VDQVDEVPTRCLQVHQVAPGEHEVTTRKKPKRHDAWSSFTVPMCAWCIQAGHVGRYHVRYPVQCFSNEFCKCPCGGKEGTR